jgi:hypothetical protein
MGVTAAAVAFGLSGCGGGDEPAAAPTSSTSSTTTSSTSSSSATTTSTPTPTQTRALAPLSRYENDPRVKGLRQFAYQYGRAINAKNRNYKPWLATLSPKAVKERGEFIDEDLGQRYPGPIPFTPVKVTATSGSSARISLCLQWQGWGRNPKTKKPARAADIGPGYVDLLKREGRWVVDTLGRDTTFSCSKTKVVGRGW